MPTTVQVRFTPNPAAEHITNYQILESVNGGPFGFKANVAPDASPLGIDVLNPAPGVYAYKVLAQNLAGDSAPSASADTGQVPSTPATPTVTVVVS